MSSRRRFIKNTGLAIGVSTITDIMRPISFGSAAQIDLDIYATNWGFMGSMDDFCRKAKQAGYDGIEVWTPQKDGIKDLMDEVAAHELKLGLLAGNWGKNFEEQLGTFRNSIDRA